ncbi:hypothetical protein [uncultured Cohaesibacter sp.]|uniref:hypothetical protein n=1 Tax=uncultured Cohaesibacter sp. TaxID=1002546 RepID=UPI0029C86993|nr:hypothetical protein [uncultured Cohaesibacter sp.]
MLAKLQPYGNYQPGHGGDMTNSAAETVFAAIAAAKENGVRVFYDANLWLKFGSIERARAILFWQAWHQAAILKHRIIEKGYSRMGIPF